MLHPMKGTPKQKWVYSFKTLSSTFYAKSHSGTSKSCLTGLYASISAEAQTILNSSCRNSTLSFYVKICFVIMCIPPSSTKIFLQLENYI